MKTKQKTIFTSIFLFIAFILPGSTILVSPVYAVDPPTTTPTNTNSTTTSGSGSTSTTPPTTDLKTCEQLKLIDSTHDCTGDVNSILNGVVGTIINILTLVIGAISVVVIIIGGLIYILSAGDANNIKRAKDIILYALIGLAVAIFAQAIVRFLIGRF